MESRKETGMNISESACTLLSNLLAEAQAPEGSVARIVPVEEGLSLTIDSVQSADATFHHEGKPVLAVPETLVAAIDDKTLDVVSTPQGPQLTLTPSAAED
jgi:hypothetical protein